MTKFLLPLLLALGTGFTSAADGPKFHNDFEKALAEARATGKPMITIFSAKWCGPCLKMKKKVYPSEEVAPFHDSFIWAYLDADSGKNRSLMKQFNVSGIPHITFVSASGEVISSMKGAVPAASFAGILSATLEKNPPVAPIAPAEGQPEKKKKGFFGLFKKKE
jgi:thioredoxin-related protein